MNRGNQSSLSVYLPEETGKIWKEMSPIERAEFSKMLKNIVVISIKHKLSPIQLLMRLYELYQKNIGGITEFDESDLDVITNTMTFYNEVDQNA